MKLQCPTIKDVHKAAKRLDGHARVTPLVHSKKLSAISGLPVWLKDETAQKTRTFKYRGAFNRISAMSEGERRRGVVAFSSGNHAQGVALAAKELGIDAKIVMPDTAPDVKIDATKRSGAQIIFYDPLHENREKIAQEIAKTDGRILVPSYDDPFIIAGQGTCGLEIAAQCESAGIVPAAFVMPLGGGGLCAGVTLAVKDTFPDAAIFGAEPYRFDDHYRSLAAGQIISNPPGAPSLCDALLSPSPGRLTFAINQNHLSAVLRVSDEECLLALAACQQTENIHAEPGGAAALAGVLAGRHKMTALGGPVIVIISGGNADASIRKRAQELAFARSA